MKKVFHPRRRPLLPFRWKDAPGAVFAGALGLFILVACSGPKPVSEEGTQEEVETVVSEEIDLDTLDVVIAEEPEVITSSKKGTGFEQLFVLFVI